MEKEYQISLSDSEIRDHFLELKNQLLRNSDKNGYVSLLNAEDLIVILSVLSQFTPQEGTDDFFKSEKHKLAFMLLNKDGTIFDDELGIKKKHYIDKNAAKEWKKKYSLLFHPDKNKIEGSINYDDVMHKINKIYSRMVGKA
ncbi:TPA: hypothetical protein NG317_004551 [Vibrio parahaemolyticus]|nr:hypothetical protein [Vibrio parahaemolyticus]HCE3084507.1 hypothetical protein [Vibrio parahaemolyticus]HCG7650331.1 hypothetical protein [Vibrio parahaemolyticus]